MLPKHDAHFPFFWFWGNHFWVIEPVQQNVNFVVAATLAYKLWQQLLHTIKAILAPKSRKTCPLVGIKPLELASRIETCIYALVPNTLQTYFIWCRQEINERLDVTGTLVHEDMALAI